MERSFNKNLQLKKRR